MFLFTVIAFIPLMYYQDYNQSFLRDNPQYNILFENDYRTWLLISVFVTVPMVIEVILDYSRNCMNDIEFKNWISRIVLIAALILPNIVLYFLLSCNGSKNYPYIPQLQLSIYYSQQVVIVGSLFCTMFEHRWSNVLNPNDRLTFSIEERTVYFLLTFTIAKLFVCFSVLFPSAYSGLYGISAVLATLGVLQILIVLVQSLQFLAHQATNFRFKSHHHMSDFFHLLTALFFVITDFLLLTISQRLLDISPSESNLPSSRLYVKEFLYIQILLTYLLTVIPGRSYILWAEIQQEKLNTRLNLIRYVSHEMRTPLNTAFLGLAMVLTDIKSIQRKYTAKTSNLKETIQETLARSPPPMKKISEDMCSDDDVDDMSVSGCFFKSDFFKRIFCRMLAQVVLFPCLLKNSFKPKTETV
jgi:hypothetical protein